MVSQRAHYDILYTEVTKNKYSEFEFIKKLLKIIDDSYFGWVLYEIFLKKLVEFANSLTHDQYNIFNELQINVKKVEKRKDMRAQKAIKNKKS